MLFEHKITKFTLLLKVLMELSLDIPILSYVTASTRSTYMMKMHKPTLCILEYYLSLLQVATGKLDTRDVPNMLKN